MQKELCCRSLANQERWWPECSTGIQCFLRSRTFTRRLHQIQEWGELSFCITTPVHKLHLMQEKLVKENTETFPHSAYSPALVPVPFSCSHIRRNASQENVLGQISALETAVFQCLSHIPKETYWSAFLRWTGWLEKYVAAGVYFEKAKYKIFLGVTVKHKTPRLILLQVPL